MEHASSFVGTLLHTSCYSTQARSTHWRKLISLRFVPSHLVDDAYPRTHARTPFFVCNDVRCELTVLCLLLKNLYHNRRRSCIPRSPSGRSSGKERRYSWCSPTRCKWPESFPPFVCHAPLWSYDRLGTSPVAILHLPAGYVASLANLPGSLRRVAPVMLSAAWVLCGTCWLLCVEP